MKIILCFLCLLNSISAISSTCRSHCGNIKIPYPFGIEDGCYHNDWYKMDCNKSGAFLPKIDKEVVQIDLPRPLEQGAESISFGSLRIKTNVASMGCKGGDGGNSEKLLNLTGTPFSISGNNTLVAFGCDNKATLTNIGNRIVGCISTCDFWKLLLTYNEKGCDGYKCCNASIPEEVGQNIVVKIESTDDVNRTKRGCRVAFLTDQYNQPSKPWGNRTDPKWFHERQDYFTIQLKWQIITTNMSFQESLPCGTVTPSGDFHNTPCDCAWIQDGDKLTYLRCACTYGYEGNPYDVGGCKDIDECKILDEGGRPKYCISGETCENTPGSHRCVIKKDKTFLIYIGVSVVLAGAAVWVYKLIIRRKKMNLRKKFFKRNGGLLLEQRMTSGEGSVDTTRIFSAKELEKATESFSSEKVLGQGGQGTVYKGMLDDGRIVAVKKSTVLDEDNVEPFINELVVLSQVNHRNIVRILGCCLETDVPVLVYEFIPNGNLFQHLHQELADHSMMTWEVRLQIALDIAGALSYLHSIASCPIYHKDIKSTNIMLDENCRAKLADFGSSRVIAVDHTHLTTAEVSGTAGYVDPEYFQSYRFTEKSDVYSYGVVLAEIVTGEKALSVQENTTLATHFLNATKENRLSEIMDPRIKGDCNLEQVTVVAKIARLCLNLKGEKRPNMREIWMELEKISSSHPEVLSVWNEEEEVAQVNIGRGSLNIDVASTSTSQTW